MKIFVSVVDSKRKKQTFAIREKPIIVGRSKKSHVVINDDLTSSQHMMIYVKDNCVFVEDLKSKNGIFLNGIKVFKQRMYIDDKVKMGDTLLYFEHKKMDNATSRLLTSEDSTRVSSNELTLELETYKEKTSRIKNPSLKKNNNKDFVKDSKLYDGVADDVKNLKGPSGLKLRILEYIAIIIDLIFSSIFSVLPFILFKKIKPTNYESIMKPVTSITQLFTGDALYLSCASLLLVFFIFKLVRGRKKGSLGEKIIGLD